MNAPRERAASNRRVLILGALVGSAVAACAGFIATSGSFGSRFPDNDRETTARIVSQLPRSTAATAPDNGLRKPLVVATLHGETPTVVVYDLEAGRELWRKQVRTDTRPQIVGGVVMAGVGTDVLAWDLASGAERWRAETDGLAFIGATADESTVYYVLSLGNQGGARRVGTLRAVDARTGALRWDHQVPVVFGAPAVAGRFVFIPWERQNLTVLDARTGDEVARFRTTDDVLAWVEAFPEGVYYGSRDIYRLTSQSHGGTKRSTTHAPAPAADAPGEPLIHADGFLPVPANRTARGRIRYHFRPAASTDERIAVAGDTVYFTYFRFVFGLATDGALRWAIRRQSDVISAAATEAGLFVVTEDGTVALLDAQTGHERWTRPMGAPLAAAELSVAGFAPEGSAGAAPNLRTSLSEIVLDPDNRLVPARAFAIRLLARMEDPEITRDLLDLYAQRSMPGALREEIGRALRARRTGTQHLVEALARHYDYLEQTEPPPLAIIVPALLEAQERTAVPRLIEHMMDHETPMNVLALVITAIVELGDAQVVGPLREFVIRYHADSTFRTNIEPLAAAAAGLLRHGGDEGRQMVTALGQNPQTLQPLVAAVTDIFDRERRAADARARAEAEAEARATAEAQRQAEAALPEMLSQEAINGAFAERADAIRACITQELERTPTLAQIRILFILERNRRARQVTFAPNTPQLVACLRPSVEAVEFPRFRAIRQRASFVISVRGRHEQDGGPGEAVASLDAGMTLPPPMPVEEPGVPWWMRQRDAGAVATTARDAGASSEEPWWVAGGGGGDTTPPPSMDAGAGGGGWWEADTGPGRRTPDAGATTPPTARDAGPARPPAARDAGPARPPAARDAGPPTPRDA
ncbi:MAG: PQQ-binding-like beta-propeller repeat protein, partial [Deltaproteobacteria bacterium]|nr:PQQ-binding-like beta-propeller repeat protein [Deltaproteobacteria bacterium]